MVALLHDDVSDAWLIVLLQTDAGLPDGQELIVQHLWKTKAPSDKLETKGILQDLPGNKEFTGINLAREPFQHSVLQQFAKRHNSIPIQIPV